MIRRLYPALVIVLLIIAAASTVRADKVKVQISGGYDEIESFRDNDIVYISLSEMAEIFGGTLSWEIVGHRVSYHDASFRFEFLLGSPFCVLNDTTLNMTWVSVLRHGQLYVPVATFLPFLDRVTPQKLTWQPERKMIQADLDYFNVTDMAVQAKANGLLIEIYLSKAMAYEIFVTEGNWLNISIRDAKINHSRLLSRKDSRLMYNLKVHQVENNTGQISMRLKRNVEKWHHKIEHNPTRIQISISDVNFELDTAPPVAILGPDDKIDVIVIDAGHGGKDYGAIGRSGTREKDIALNIAKKLAKLIRKDKQFKVIMTRDRDRTVSLEKRAAIANDAGADLFISIHANASPKRHVRGWNVFFLAPALNDTARAVEQLENSYFLRESGSGNDNSRSPSATDDPILSIINEMLMTEFQAESNEFAMMVDREFRRRLKIKARGVDQAGFFVLNKVFTPSVLIESGFISNKAEEKQLKNKKYQQQVAEGLYAAIKRFRSKFESR